MAINPKRTNTDFAFRHQDQVDQYGPATGDFTIVQANFDTRAEDNLADINQMKDALASVTLGDSGAHAIGLKTPSSVGVTVADELELIRQAGSGTIPPDNSVTNPKLGADVKVGSLAALTTTAKTDVVSAINEVDGDVGTNTSDIATNKTILDIARTAKTDTGSANAYAVDTDGTFDLTKDGNILTFIPNNTNTTVSTIAVDAQTAKAIKKANDSGTLVDVEAGDLLKNRPSQLVWSVGSDFFILRPSGGSNIKTIQRGSFSATFTSQNVTVSAVDKNKCLLLFTVEGSNVNDLDQQVAGYIVNNTTINFQKFRATTASIVKWQLIEFNNVKSRQEGLTTFNNAGSATATITSVNTGKSIVVASFKTTTTDSTNYTLMNTELTNSTTVTFESTGGTFTDRSIRWQVIEFA